MGGGKKRSRTQRRHFKESRENVWKKDRSNDRTSANPSWEPFATQNSSFEEYYKEQRIVLEEEWDAFLSILRKPLPAAFRINSSGQFFEGIRFQLENDFMKSLELEIHNENMEVEAVRPLPWYPENLAWHSNFSRMQLRKNQALERFHQFLMLENTIGNISRQEAVSMVPALLLDICSDHFVLDMCAAPGSKTFQLLEMMHRSSELGTLPNGMVIANDADVQRCNLLIHQTKRMCSANLIVTNHLAQHFPSCHLKDKSSISSTISCQSGEFIGIYEPDDGHKTLMKTELLFDRVLCDVPCSGDGTLRKAPDIWRKWSVGLGNGIHRLQVQIAMRGIALLKVGGRMVYSTCSMNPIENEAVVAEVLRRCGGSVELLDVSSELPQLIRRPGLKNWKVRDKGSWLASYNDVSTHRRSAIVPSMFPSYQSYDAKETVNGAMDFNDMKENGTIPCSNYEHQNEGLNEPSKMSKSSQVVYEGETSEFPLERCMRIVPHDQNSGAFFIAVFQKLFYRPVTESPPSSMSKDITNSTPENEDSEAAVEEREFAKDILEDIPEKLPLLEESTSADNMEETVPENDMAIESFDDTKENSTICKGKSDLNKPKMENRKIQIQGKWKGVDPVVFFQDNTTISVIRSFYGIESFPLDGHLVSRSSDAQHVKRIYYISKSVRNVLKLNFHVGQQLKITSIGLKIFERQTAKEDSRHSSPCPYRISSEGLPLLLPYITKQILYASLTDFEHLLEYRSIKFLDFVEPGFGEKASNLTLGCCVIVLNLIDVGSTSDITRIDSSTVALGCWKGRTNISVMASEVDCRGLLERLSIRLGRPLGRKTLNDQNSSQSNSSSITETLEDDTAK